MKLSIFINKIYKMTNNIKNKKIDFNYKLIF